MNTTPVKANIDRINAKKFANYYEEAVPFSEKADRLRRSLDHLIESPDFQNIESMPIEDQIVGFTSCLTSDSKDVRIGGLQGIFDILSIHGLSEAHSDLVVEEVLQSLQRWEEQDLDFLECALDILGNIGPHPRTIECLHILLPLIVHDEDTPYSTLHTNALSCVSRLGMQGLDGLVRLASRDHPYFQHWILEKLALTNIVQRSIIVPALAQDAINSDSHTRAQAVAALNRMYSLIWEGGVLPVLLSLMQEGAVDRQLIACAIRASGNIGEQTLIKLLKQSENPKIRMASASALCWRVPKRPRQIEIKVMETSDYLDMKPPGSMIRYVGPIQPVVFQEDEDNSYLEIYSRDFLATLQRFVRQEEGKSKNLFLHQPPLSTINDVMESQEPIISMEAISALCHALKDEFEGVRETAAYALGFIGLPEAGDSVNSLIPLLKDSSPQVRTMAAWAAGRFGELGWKAVPMLIHLLKDGYWKVRTAACISIASAGQNCVSKAIPILLKVLKDGSINRATVAETIVRLGPKGEQVLIDILNTEPHSNLKLRTGVVKALSFANTAHNNIDFVVETLFKYIDDRAPAVRKECILSLQTLCEQSKGQVTYLKIKSLLPVYFKTLKDPDKEVRDTGLKCIHATGPQGQLMLIEGATKDPNPRIRSFSAKGLGLFGPSTFRSLLLTLFDSHPGVRK